MIQLTQTVIYYQEVSSKTNILKLLSCVTVLHILSFNLLQKFVKLCVKIVD
jgi:hypothetical protein